MTVTKNGIVWVGYEASCSCGWIGSWADVPSMAGFEFCPACKKRYVGYITRAWVDRRPTKRAADVCHESVKKTHSWYGSSQGYVCEHCGTRR